MNTVLTGIQQREQAIKIRKTKKTLMRKEKYENHLEQENAFLEEKKYPQNQPPVLILSSTMTSGVSNATIGFMSSAAYQDKRKTEENLAM